MSTGTGARGVTGPVEAVLFDLDDTLVPQAPWLEGAFGAVAAAAAASSPALDVAALRRALVAEATLGSARGAIIDRVVAARGLALPVGPLVAAFRAYRAEVLEPYPGVRAALHGLRAVVRTGVVSDGDTAVQEAKLRAAGLADAFDVVVLSDAIGGRATRKPHPAPYERALAVLGVAPAHAVFVGDRPDTDMVGADRLGMRTVRVRTGEYAARPDEVAPTVTVSSLVEAVAWVHGVLGAACGPGRRR